MSNILTVEQAASKLHLKPLTVREYLRKGKIPGKKLGRSWRILENELENSLSEVTTKDVTSIDSLIGLCADIPGFSTKNYMEQKSEEIKLENRRFEEN